MHALDRLKYINASFKTPLFIGMHCCIYAIIIRYLVYINLNIILDRFHGTMTIAREHRVPRCTLRRRWLENQNDSRHRAGHSTILSHEQETELVSYILQQQRNGFPMSVDDARKLAYQYCSVNEIPHMFNESKKIAGWKWWMKFRGRNPQVTLRKAENLSRSRALGMEKNRVEQFFGRLDALLSRFGIKDDPTRIYNVDETGLQTVTERGKVLAAKGSRLVQTITSAEKGATTTIVLCCSAEGHFIPPMVIFKGSRNAERKNLAGQFPAGTLITYSKNGWIDKELFLVYFHHFLSNLPPRTSDEKVVLLMDSHASHTSLPLLQEARVKQVELVALPSHTSHHLQPLDVAVFAAFKKSWSERCRQFLSNNRGKIISRAEFGPLFAGAYNHCTTAEKARCGFRKAGICPLNFGAIDAEAFLPAAQMLSPVASSDNVLDGTTDIEVEKFQPHDEETESVIVDTKVF